MIFFWFNYTHFSIGNHYENENMSFKAMMDLKVLKNISFLIKISVIYSYSEYWFESFKLNLIVYK